MPGHISIYIKDSKTLIAGDALVVEDDKLTIANPQYTLDIISAKNSIKKLLNYEIDKIVCYHGGVYTKDIKNHYKILFQSNFIIYVEKLSLSIYISVGEVIYIK